MDSKQRCHALLAEGIAHHQAGRLGEAEAAYRRALALAPEAPDALHLSGVIARQTGRHRDAVDMIGRALALNPQAALYHRNMAVALSALDRDGDALGHFEQAVALDPSDMGNLLGLASAYDRADRPVEAAGAYQKALAGHAGDAEIHTAAAVALMKSGDHEAAGEHFSRALELAPDESFTNTNMGRFLIAKGDPAGAESLLRRAIELDPDAAEAHVELGALLADRFDLDEAMPLLQRAEALRPDHIETQTCLGNALRDAGHPADARLIFQRLVDANPDNDALLTNLGLSLAALGEHQDALAAYDQAIRLRPDNQEARSNRSLIRLALGDFAGGWEDGLSRASVRAQASAFHREKLPDDLTGRRIRLCRDQGLGDEIFFLRLARELKARGAWIAYDPDPKIAEMIGRLPFIDELVESVLSPDGYDFICSIGDLPHLITLKNQDLPPPFEIPVIPERDAEMRARLAGIAQPPYMGITWRAGVQHYNKLSKLTPLAAVIEAVEPLPGTVIVLQRMPESGELDMLRQSLGPRLLDLSDLNDDLEGMLALLGLIDEYICVSNTNTHLRAGRGRASRVLVPMPPDYRWMESGDESPWFPGLSLYRESVTEGWAPAFGTLSRDLAGRYVTD